MKIRDIEIITDNILFIKTMISRAILNAVGNREVVSPGMYYVMLVLEKNGPLPMSGISREMLIPKPNVTKLVDKLIADGLVERIPDAADRRIIKIRLSRKGEKVKNEINKALTENAFRKTFNLTEKDIKIISGHLIGIREIFAKRTDSKQN
ncbi:MAG: MarR family transcriptional regulator [Bacteroidetes bacterium]|nr:MarR family transcriptional regulator [Bacteroidota bacterium]